jgi:hypothetical protein
MSFKKWLARIDFINKEYPFGELRILKNAEGNIHSDTSPAYVSETRVVWYNNGKKHGLDVDIFGSITYYYENILVPSNYITNKESLTIEKVLANPNTEVRYVGIRIMGYDKLKEKAVTIHASKNMELFYIAGIFTDSVTILKVVNSTPESDGSFKNYYLTVPPDMKTCEDAVAWTFYKKKSSYKPQVET